MVDDVEATFHVTPEDNGTFPPPEEIPDVEEVESDTTRKFGKGVTFAWSYQMNLDLNRLFNIEDYRANQLEAMNASLAGNDVFVLMPTGGGKSLCYQLPALQRTGITVVISPLLSLIFDQVTSLTNKNIPAAHLTSTTTPTMQRQVMKDLNESSRPILRLLYTTPEKLCLSGTLLKTFETLHNKRMIAQFVVDEAHCVSQWG